MRQRARSSSWIAVAIVAAVSWMTMSDRAGVSLGRVAAQTSQPQTSAAPGGQSATRLADGRWLLAGGDGAGATAAIWDPATGTAARTSGPTQTPRAWHSATLLADGTVLLLGGRDGAAIVETAERFDPASGTFTVIAMIGSAPRASHTATLLTDGRVLVAGGSNGSPAPLTTEIWDVAAGTVVPLGGAPIDRAGQTATLDADGRVRISGGSALNGAPAGEAVVIDPIGGGVVRATPVPDSGTVIVAGSIPTPSATDVAVDTRLTVRFSEPAAVDSLTSETLRLTGPDGPVTVRIVAAEGGRLAFVWPGSPLSEGATYTLTVARAVSARGLEIVPSSITFTTIAHRAEASSGDPEEWIPDADAIKNGWRTNRPPSPWETLAPLLAPPGVTAISGRVLTLDGRPLPRVTLAMDGAGETRSDGTGRFLLEAPALTGGRHVLDIEGKTASRPDRTYGFFEYGLTVTPGQTTVLPFTIWMPKLDTAHAVTIPSPTTSEAVVTTPYIPGLELHLPPQTVIRGEDGKTVTQISITAIPVDRTPFPLAKNVEVPVYFTIQPGGAYVATGGAGPKGASLVYPNYHHAPIGKRVQFYHYDPDDLGWYVYGIGEVTADAQQVRPDPATRLYTLTGAMISNNPSPPSAGPPHGDCCGTDGDPVNLATGLFTLDTTDLYLPDVMPIAVTRTYRQRDTQNRPFGIGTSFPYAMFLWSVSNYTQADLVLPDGATIHYVRTSAGTAYTDAVYTHQETQTTSATPTSFYKSTLSWNGGGWDLRVLDGTVYVFGDTAPLQAIRDRFGNQTTVTWSSTNGFGSGFGNVTRVTSPNGRWIAFTYDPSNRITQAKDNINRTVTYEYDGAGNLTTVTDPENHVTSYTYDADHQMLTVKPPSLQGTQSNLVTNVYTTSADAPTPVGWVKTQTHVDNGVYQFAYTFVDGKISQTLVTDPRDKQRRVTFNADGYTVADRRAVGDPDEQGDTSDRPARNNFVTSSTNSHGDVTNTEYDTLGRVTRVTRLPGTSDEAVTTYTYDPVWTSEVATITDPLNHTTTFGYDAKGNRVSITDALTHTTTFAYNSAGQVTSVTDPLQHTAAFEYAGPDLVKITDPLGHITQRFFDAAGRLLTQTDPAGQTTRFAYDKVNHLTQVTDPLQGLTGYGYDTAGRLATITDALTHVTTYGYDALDRLASRTDPLSKQETFTYDEIGNPHQRTDRKGQVTTRAYDALNRLHQLTHADNSTITYTYDAGNRLTTIDDSLNGTITRTYDNLDRLTSETTAQGSISYTYDKADRRATMTVTGQPTVTYGYDNANRLTSVTQGMAVVTVTYDNASRRSTLTLPNGIVTTYVYDDGNQLTSLTYTLGQTTLGTLTYNYDLAGRRTQVGGTWARTGLPQAVATTAYDGANRLMQWAGGSFSYDPNGNLTSDGPTSYSWNARDQLATLSGAANANFLYDGIERRRSKTVNGTTSSFLYDRANLVQELAYGGTPTANFLTGLGIDETFTRTDGVGASSLIVDALGSTLELADATGILQTHYTLEAFGGTSTSGAGSANATQFTGRENDAVGLYYYRGRYYDPIRSRFISEDLLSPSDSAYAYVSNLPTSYIDPSGWMEVSDDIKVLVVDQRRIPGNAVARTSAAAALVCWCKCENGAFRLYSRLLVSGRMLLPRVVTRTPAFDKSVVDTNTASAHEYAWHILPAIAAVRKLVEPAEATSYSSQSECEGKCT